MKPLNFKFLFLVFLCINSTMAQAFEPVSIDDFFKQYPNEKQKKSAQPTIQTPPPDLPNNKNTALEQSNPNLNYELDVTGRQFPQVDVLVLDRILGHSKIVRFDIGQTKLIDNLFKVTINDCIQRKTEFSQSIHSVPMQILSVDTKSDNPLLYNTVFYVEIPGFRGFEHPIYDIRPLKCVGKPKVIDLNKYETVLLPTAEETQTDKKADAKKQTSKNTSVEEIISNTEVPADL